jgi:CubicO group peptidase (beta-lactamase class C family)
MKRIDNLIVTALNNKAFSCAGLAFSQWQNGSYTSYLKNYGVAHKMIPQVVLEDNHFFDLASLTKPLATVLVLLAFFEKRLISPKTEIGEIYRSCPEHNKKISIEQLLCHESGFVAHREYFHELILLNKETRKKWLRDKILNEQRDTKSEVKSCYSDLGFMLLGFILEKISGKGLDELSRSLIYAPLGLENSLIFPGLEKERGFVYVDTEKCIWDKTELSGRVHDDNCRALGGVAGHAGLFGTVSGVMTLCQALLDQWKNRATHPSYSNRILQRTLERRCHFHRTMGFDTVSEHGSSSGRYFSTSSVGHLGFTGTSFWIDLKRQCIAVLLTNRVCYGVDNLQIRELRPQLHDILMEELG